MNVDRCTITVALASSDMRSALVDFAAALEDAEAVVVASGASIGSVRSSNKPGSKPPAGNLAAAKLCRTLANDAAGAKRKVEAFYVKLDPEERAAARRQRAELKEIVARDRQDAQQSIVSMGRSR